MALKNLPDGFSGAPMGRSSEPDEDVVAQQNQPDRSVLDMIMDAPEAVSQAYTGEGVPIEFPNLPELTDMGADAPGFFEGFGVRLKGMMARDDFGKAEIIHDAFDGDPRYGGRYSDEYGLPMIVWNDVPYYINKPGASGMDLNTLLGEFVRYAPASKLVGGAKTTLSTIGRGLGLYSGTEVATIAGENIITPETYEAKKQTLGDQGKQVGLSTAIGVGADVMLPPIARGIGAVIKATARSASKSGRNIVAALEPLYPRFSFNVLQTSKYPLTQGQKSAELPQGTTPKQTDQIGREDELRQMSSSSMGTDTVRGFDERQLTEIRQDALTLQQEFGSDIVNPSGIYGNIPSVAAEEAQTLVSGAAQRLKTESGELYETVKSADPQPVMTAEGVQQVAQELLDVVPTIIRPSQIVDGPLFREIIQLRRLKKIAQNPKFKDQALKNIHGYQKRLRTAIKQAEKDSPEELALIQMKQKLDDAVYNGVERGFITGDQEVLDQLQQATGLYSDYMATVGKGVGRNPQEKSANRILEQLSTNQYTPVQVTQLLFGQNKFAPNQAVGVVLDKLKKSLGPDEYAQFVALMKDGIMTKAFAGKGGEITRKSIVDNYNDVFFKNRDIINRLFTPDEIARVKDFRTNVLPTIWAETKLNTSGTAYSLMSAASRAGMLNAPSIPLRMISQKVLSGSENLRNASDAANAVSQTIFRMNTPMFSDATQSVIRTSLPPQDEAEAEAMSDSERNKLLQAIEGFEAKQEEAEPAPAPVVTPPPVAQAAPVEEAVSPIFEPIASGPTIKPPFDPAMSPTIVPLEKDRELAMRTRGNLGGIASLA